MTTRFAPLRPLPERFFLFRIFVAQVASTAVSWYTNRKYVIEKECISYTNHCIMRRSHTIIFNSDLGSLSGNQNGG